MQFEPARATIGGAIASMPDPTDLIFEDLPGGPALAAHSALNILPARDQLDRGTCSAFVAATIRQIVGGYREYLSPEFVYALRENRPVSGMCGRDALRVMRGYGIPYEKDYPYGSTDTLEGVVISARKHQIGGFAKVLTVDGLKRAILESGACYVQLPLYNSSAEFWKSDNQSSIGLSHAVTAIGFNNDGIVLQNSWGETWNGNGHTLLLYSDWKYVIECWTVFHSAKKCRGRSLSH